MTCKDHQGNIIDIGTHIAFSRDHFCYKGEVIGFTKNNNPTVYYYYFDYKNKQITTTYSITRPTRYIKLY